MHFNFATVLIVALLLIGVGIETTSAQNLVTCPGLVKKAIESVGSNCGQLNRNSACYGFQNVEASFSQPQPNGFFTQPSDQARLFDLENLITSPMDQQVDKWGVALLNVQANLPDTLPGQNVIFMLLGDTQVENAVPPDQAFRTGAIASVTLQIGANMFYLPNFDAQVVGSVPAGTTITADAISPDGQWVRVGYNGIPGWVTFQVIQSDDDLTALPIIGPDTKTPMQAFYFRTGISGTDCLEAPNSLVIQGPKNLMVDIQANGADMRLGSTVALYLLPVDAATQAYLNEMYGDVGSVTQLMQIIVLDGHVVLNAGTPDEIHLNTGETSFICLSEPENLGADGQENDRHVFNACPWAPPRPVTVEEIAKFSALDGQGGTFLNYPVDLSLDLTDLTPTATPTSTRIVQGSFIQPTFTPTFTPTLTPTLTPVAQQQQQQQQQQSGTATHTPTITPTPTITHTPTDTLTPTTTHTPTETLTSTNTSTPTDTSTSTSTPTDTATPEVCPPFDFTNIPDTATFMDAVNAANDEICHPGTDTIQLGSGATYTFTSIYDSVNALPPVTSSIVIEGNGSNLSSSLEIQRRYFQIDGTGSLTLRNLLIRNGSLGSDTGGAILNSGSLGLSRVTLRNNGAQNGGAIYNNGTLTIDSSTFDSNNAGEQGGGIFSNGSVTIVNSTFGGNYAGNGGSAIHNASGSTTISFTTIGYNFGESGGAFNVAGGSATSKNSIISNNSPSNCGGTVSTQGVNFQDDSSCTSFSYNDNIGLNTLDDNGGSPQTEALSSGSAAIDAVSDCTTSGGAAVNFDERGVGRPIDGNNSETFECDAGAYEADAGGGAV